MAKGFTCGWCGTRISDGNYDHVVACRRSQQDPEWQEHVAEDLLRLLNRLEDGPEKVPLRVTFDVLVNGDMDGLNVIGLVASELADKGLRPAFIHLEMIDDEEVGAYGRYEVA